MHTRVHHGATECSKATTEKYNSAVYSYLQVVQHRSNSTGTRAAFTLLIKAGASQHVFIICLKQEAAKHNCAINSSTVKQFT